MGVTISVITPALNAQHMVAETISSVVNQSAFISGRAKLQYILQDGGSRDNTVTQAMEASRGIIDARSSNDVGMYDALAKGFRAVDGDIVCYLNVGDYLFLGRGEEKTGGRGKESITSSALEAVIAAIYRDGGLPAARKFIKNHFRKVILEMENELACFDYKSTLQQYLQARHRKVPKYVLVNETGPDHKKEFEVKITFNHKELARGQGKNKKEAEQDAARLALQGFEV